MGTIRNPKDIDDRVDADRMHEVGDRVQWKGTGEVGVVVRTWYNEEIQEQDCYVCFDDSGNPDSDRAQEGSRPYVLRYSAPSLYPVGWDQEPLDAWWDDKPEPWDEEPHPIESYPKKRPARGIEVTKTEQHVIEYDEIVAYLLGELDEGVDLPDSKADCEELITLLVQDEYGYPHTGEHDRRGEVEELVKGFYTDFENREW